MTSPAPTPENPGLVNWLLIMTLGFIWGAAFLGVSVALQGFEPLTVAAGRVGLGALALLLLGTVMGQGLRTLPSRRAWGFATVIGVMAVALPFTLLSWGQQFVPSAFAGVAMGAVPLMVLPLVYVFSPDEGIGPRRVAGVVLGFVGLWLLVGPGAGVSTGHPNESAGRLACLAAAACYAGGSIVTRRAPKMPPIAFATATLVTAAAVLVPVALLIEGLPAALPTTPSLALLYVALFPTALAAIIRVRVITTAGSLFMSLVAYIVPLWSVVLGVSLMGELVPPQMYIALALILAGIGISQSRAIAQAFKTRRSRHGAN